jgi:glycosyltransferase involved in cell wall biosynthesis
MTRLASVVVPAHNEEAVIGHLLARLLESAQPDELDIVVVANGCTDGTVEAAQAFSHSVRVVSTAIPSKREALRLGDEVARGFPRLFVDADVELGTAAVRRLCAALARPGILAAAPERDFDMAERHWLVRWYYDVWTRLPQVRCGLFGRGVLAVSDAGHRRIAALPPVMADDLAFSLAFTEAESTVVHDCAVRIRPPRTWQDLLRRRIRAETGISQVERDHIIPGTSARTTRRDLLGVVRREPRLSARMPVFLFVAMVARLGARRALRHEDYSTWLRDESSRRR